MTELLRNSDEKIQSVKQQLFLEKYSRRFAIIYNIKIFFSIFLKPLFDNVDITKLLRNINEKMQSVKHQLLIWIQ